MSKKPILAKFERNLLKQFEKLRGGVSCARDVLMTLEFKGSLSKTVVVLSYSDILKELTVSGSLRRLPVKCVTKYLAYYSKYTNSTITELIYVKSNLIHEVSGNQPNSLHMMIERSFNKKFIKEII